MADWPAAVNSCVFPKKLPDTVTDVRAVPGAEDECVRARSAVQGVVPGPAIRPVVAVVKTDGKLCKRLRKRLFQHR